MEDRRSSTDMQPLIQRTVQLTAPCNSEKLTQPITIAEISRAIHQLEKRKETGPDGIRTEFYQCNPDMWANILCSVFEKTITSRHQTPKLARNSIPILLHKDGDAKCPSHFRPIAVVNILVRVLTKAYAVRVRNVTYQLVAPIEQDSLQENP